MAIRDKDLDEVCRLMVRTNDPDFGKDLCALVAAYDKAVKYGDLDKVRVIVSTQIASHSAKQLFAFIAVYDGHESLVRYISTLGVDMSAGADSCIRQASASGQLSIVRYLAELGANIHARDDECLRRASAGGHLAVVQFLVGLGADTHARDDECVREASANGHLSVVRYLVGLGANIRAVGDWAIRQASRYGYSTIVRHLAEFGANVALPMVKQHLASAAEPGRAAQQLYFAWVPRCYDRRRVGRRMTRRNFRDYLRL